MTAEPALLWGCWPPTGSGRRSLCPPGWLPPTQVRGGCEGCWHGHIRILRATPRGGLGTPKCGGVLEHQSLWSPLALLADQLGAEWGCRSLAGKEERHLRASQQQDCGSTIQQPSSQLVW